MTPKQRSSRRNGRGLPPDGGADPVAPPAPELPPYDPNWQPSDLDQKLDQAFGGQLRERKRSHWFPHLLIRGATGDTGARPLWQPTPCWTSPDIHVLPVGAGLDLSRSVLQPEVGKSYQIAVHVWNLGRSPAFGITVRAWWVEPGFFAGTTSTAYLPQFIGGTFTQLGDRDSGDAHRLVLIPQPWTVQNQADGHECLLAVVECFADNWGGALTANADRHVAQRNVSLLRGTDDAASLLATLSETLPPRIRLSLATSTLERPSLAAAAARGMASNIDTTPGRGPIDFGELNQVATHPRHRRLVQRRTRRPRSSTGRRHRRRPWRLRIDSHRTALRGSPRRDQLGGATPQHQRRWVHPGAPQHLKLGPWTGLQPDTGLS